MIAEGRAEKKRKVMVKFYQKRNGFFSHLEFSPTNYKIMREIHSL